RPASALAVLIAALAFAVARRVSLGGALHRLAHVEGFLVLLLLFLPFTTPGRPVWTPGPLEASAEGLALGLLIALKVNAVAVSLLVLLAGTAPEGLGRALL